MMKQCENGHLYDDKKNAICPYCGSKKIKANKTDVNDYLNIVFNGEKINCKTKDENITLQQSTGKFKLLVLHNKKCVELLNKTAQIDLGRIVYNDYLKSSNIAIEDKMSGDSCNISLSIESEYKFNIHLEYAECSSREEIFVGKLYHFGILAPNCIEYKNNWSFMIYPDIFSENTESKDIYRFFKAIRYIAEAYHEHKLYCQKVDDKVYFSASPTAGYVPIESMPIGTMYYITNSLHVQYIGDDGLRRCRDENIVELIFNIDSDEELIKNELLAYIFKIMRIEKKATRPSVLMGTGPAPMFEEKQFVHVDDVENTTLRSLDESIILYTSFNGQLLIGGGYANGEEHTLEYDANRRIVEEKKTEYFETEKGHTIVDSSLDIPENILFENDLIKYIKSNKPEWRGLLDKPKPTKPKFDPPPLAGIPAYWPPKEFDPKDNIMPCVYGSPEQMSGIYGKKKAKKQKKWIFGLLLALGVSVCVVLLILILLNL